MHIPSVSDTTTLDVLSFEEALRQAKKPQSDYDAKEFLYVPPFYADYRYILGTRGVRPLVCIGINPSTARPNALDNTLKSVERIALFNGFDSFLMMNVYAERATCPKDVEKCRNDFLHEENIKAYRYVLECAAQNGRPTVWTAWGNIIKVRDYFFPLLADFYAAAQPYDPVYVCAGNISKDGNPHHPLYLPKNSVLKPFDLKGYLGYNRQLNTK